MFIKKAWLSCALLSVTFVTHAMNQEAKEVIEKKRKNYLKLLGTEDVPRKIQEINDNVSKRYRQKGFFTRETPIVVKYMNDNFIETIQADGGTVWNNMCTNGQDVIHIAREHDELTDEELESKFAHEQAHVILQQTASLNPNYYMHQIHFWGFTMGVTLMWPQWVTASIALAAKSKKPLYPIIGINTLFVIGNRIDVYLYKNAYERYDVSSECPDKVRYHFLDKFVEFECDMIAATSFKNGGLDGENVYRKHLKHNGDTNGINGDHPYTSTRVLYHVLTRKWQDIFQSKEKPELK